MECPELVELRWTVCRREAPEGKEVMSVCQRLLWRGPALTVELPLCPFRVYRAPFSPFWLPCARYAQDAHAVLSLLLVVLRVWAL